MLRSSAIFEKSIFLMPEKFMRSSEVRIDSPRHAFASILCIGNGDVEGGWDKLRGK